MDSRAWAGLVVLAALLLGGVPPAAASTLAAPVSVSDAVIGAPGSVLDLSQGRATVDILRASGTVRVLIERTPCLREDEGTCVGPASRETRSIELQGASLTVTPAAQSGHHLVVDASGAGGSVEAAQGALSILDATEHDVAPDVVGNDQFHLIPAPEGPAFTPTGAADIAFEGALAMVAYDSKIVVVKPGAPTEELETGRTWVRDGVQTYRQLLLVRVQVEGTLHTSWDGELVAHLATPFSLHAKGPGGALAVTVTGWSSSPDTFTVDAGA
ncbi:MAG: hypothetical protein ACRDHK_13900, partial [Actinomycetota bacterium]